jgi:hypothetical protein
MKSSKALKVTTLVVFIFLMSSFIAYKTGMINLPLGNDTNLSQQSPVDSTKKKAKVDSVILSPAMMSTSKSAVMIDQRTQFKAKDTAKHQQK